MANTIKLGLNQNSGKTPTNLQEGEIAINSANRKIWVGTDGTTSGQVLVFDHSLYSTDLSDNDTTYSAGSGLSLSGTTFSHSDTSSQSSSNNSGRTYIQDVTLDTYGHVTGLATATETVTNTDTNTTYSAGSGLSLSSTTFSHSDTSSQGSVNNSGRTYIQDVTLDTYGHVTGLASATETVTNTDTNTTYTAGTGLSLSGTTFSVDSNVLRKTTYYNANTWLQFSGTYGLYWNTGVGAGWHIYPVNTNTMRMRAAASSSQSAVRFDAGSSTYGTLLFTDAGEFQVLDEAGDERLSIPSSGNFVRDDSYVVWDEGNVVAGSGISISGNTITNTRSDTNTTYSAGSGLSLSGTTFSHSDTSSQSSVNGSGRTYIQDVTLDTYGHVTGLATATETVTNTDTNTTYSAGSGLSLSSTTFSHSDTSSQGSVNNSGRTYIQDVTLDTYGHVTSLASATETVTNTDTNTTYSAGTGLNLSGTTFGLNESLGRNYIEMGNDTGSVSNDGSWNARFNVAGSAHARIDVYENDDGIKATMYAHTGHTGPRFGSMSNHPVNFMCNGTTRATLTTAGSLSTTVQGTLWGTSSKFTAGSNLSWSGSTLNATDTNTTYSAGSGLSLSGTSFSHSDTSSQSSVNNSGRTYIQDVTLDGYGHVTSLSSATETVTNTDTNTTYSAGSGLSLSSTTFSHSDTSSQGSVNNSGRTYIQDVTLDTYGHVTGLASATETVTNTDTNTWRPVEAGGNTLSGSETLEFKAGSNVSISESGGEVTISATDTNTNTTYSAGSGLSLSSTTFSHSDTSSQSSVNNSGRTYIQDVTLDTYGHVTGLASATETVTNSDTNTVREIYLNASSFLNNSSSGAAFDLRTSSPIHFSYSANGVAILAHENTAGNKHIPSGGSSNQYLIYSSSGTANWSTIAFSHLQNLSALNALP